MKHIITAALLLSALFVRAEIEITLLTDCICEGGDAQQAFSVVAEGSAAPFQFYWTGPNGYSSSEKEPLDIQSPGEYRLRVLNDYGCVFNYYIDLPACPDPQLEYTPTPTSPCVENGGITATFIEGASDYHSFEWYEEGGASTGAQGLELSNVGAGFYYLSLMDNNGCTFQGPLLEVEQLQAPAMEVVEAVIGDVCGILDFNSGSIWVQVQGGMPPYTYTWEDDYGNVVTTSTGYRGNLLPGNYHLTITDAYECTLTATYSVGVYSPPEATVMTQQPSCAAASDGSIELLLSPAGQYGVSWDNGATGTLATGLNPGVYTATITYGDGCTTTEEVLLDADVYSPVITSTITPASCPDASNGSVSVEVQGGTPPYVYNWGSTSSTTGNTVDGLIAGDYPFTVTDANGCTSESVAAVTAEELFELEIVSEGPVDCAGGSPDGVLSAVITADNAIYSWSKTGDPSFSSSALSIVNLDVGEYCVTVTSFEGCTRTTCYTLEGYDWPYIERVYVVAKWQGTQEVIYDAAWVEDANGCLVLQGGNTAAFDSDMVGYMEDGLVTLVVDAQANKPLQAMSLSNLPANTSSTDGITWQHVVQASAVQAMVVGGNVDQLLHFYGTDPSNKPLQDLSGAPQNMCPSFSEYQGGCVWQPAPNTTAGDKVHRLEQQGCLDFDVEINYTSSTTAKLTITNIAGAPGPYDIYWYQLAPGAVVSPDGYGVSGARIGEEYCVAVGSHAGNCVTRRCVYLCPPIDHAYDLSSQIPCASPPNSGEICLDVDAGIAIDWGNPEEGACWQGLLPSVYDILLTDLVCGQELQLQVPLDEVTPPISLNVTKRQACPGQTDGRLEAAASGGRPPYQYLWEDGTTSNTLDGLAGGTCYELTVTDDCGQQLVECITLPAYEAMERESIDMEPACTNSTNGSFTISISGGLPPFSYTVIRAFAPSFSRTGSQTSRIFAVDDLAAGFYAITVEDDCGATFYETVSVQSVDPPAVVTGVDITPSCEGGNTGAIDLTLDGSFAVESFAWDNGSNTEDLDGLSAGTYRVTITLEGGCRYLASYAVNDYAPTLNMQAASTCEGEATGAILFNFSVESETASLKGPFQADWSNGTSWSFAGPTFEETLPGLAAGSYTVTVADAQGCSFVGQSLVGQDPLPVITLEDFQNETVYPSPISPIPLGDGILAIGVSGAGSYEVNWDDNAGCGDVLACSGLSAGSYGVTVTDVSTGCSAEAVFVLKTCPPSTVAIIDPQSAGEPSNVTPALIGGDGAIDLSVYTFPSGAILSYQWEGPDGFASTQEDLTALWPGTYCVTVTNECGQRDEACYEVVGECGLGIDVSVRNRCLDERNEKAFFLNRVGSIGSLSFGSMYQPDDLFFVEWTKEGEAGPLENGAFKVDQVGWGASSSPPEWSGYAGEHLDFIMEDYKLTVPDGQAGRGTYYCTVTDKYGCKTTATAEFLNDNEKVYYIRHLQRLTQDDGTDDAWYWDLDVEDFYSGDFTSMNPTVEDEESFVNLINELLIVGRCRKFNCGCTWDDFGIYCSDENSGGCNNFCFHPNPGAAFENICTAGGYVSLPFAENTEVLPGYGQMVTVETENKGKLCGCIYPMEAFGENLPEILYWGEAIYINQINDVSSNADYRVFAYCETCHDKTLEEEEEEGATDAGPAVNLGEEYCYVEIDNKCFRITYSSVFGLFSGNNCEVSAVELISEGEGCSLSDVPVCGDCPIDFLDIFWCSDDDVCKYGMFQDENGNQQLDLGESILYHNTDPSYGICDVLDSLNNGPSTSTLFCETGHGSNCFPMPASVAYSDPSCRDDGCGCEIQLACSDGTVEYMNGTVEVTYEQDQDDDLDCPQLCHDGFYCRKKVACNFNGLNGVGRVTIEDKLETQIAVVPDSACDPQNDNDDSNNGDACTMRYYCGGVGEEHFHEFCHPDCSEGTTPPFDMLVETYACNGVEGVCPDIMPLVAVDETTTLVDPVTGGYTIRYTLDIVEDNSFRVSSVYPNPFQDELTIKLTASYDGKATIRMVNLLGQTVHMEEQAFIRGYNPLTVSTAGAQWQNGIYHLIVTDEKQNQFTEKVILQR